MIDRWQLDYNHIRTHSALDYQTPAAYAARLCSSGFGYASRTQPSYLTLILSLTLVQRLGGCQFDRNLFTVNVKSTYEEHLCYLKKQSLAVPSKTVFAECF